MKKKVTAFLALLLTFCMLFSSCVAGAGTPALLSVLRSSAGNFFTNARDLLVQNTRIIANGTALYRIVCPDTFSGEVKTEVETLRETISARTGVELPLSSVADGASIFVETLSPESAKAAGITDSVFRIYFSEGNLHIAAANEIMLAEALRCFRDTFVNSEKTYLGEGYFAISSKTDFTPATGEVFDQDAKAQYIVVRPENANDRIVNAAQSVAEAIKNATGASVKIKSDFLLSGQASDQKEILVGMCERDRVTEITASLDRTSYYIGADETGIQLIGTTDVMVESAVEDFISTFISGRNTTATKKQLLLPLSLSYFHRYDTLLLAENNLTDYMLIYADNIGSNAMKCVTQFAESFYALTGAVLPVFSDANVPKPTEREICVGITNRTENAKIAENAWNISVTGDSVYLLAGCDTAISDALETFLRHCYDRVLEQNTFETNDSGTSVVVPYQARLLYIDKSVIFSGKTAPELTLMTGKADIGENGYMMYREDATLNDYTNYLVKIAYLGYTEYTSRNVGKNHVRTATYFDDQNVLNISFVDTENLLRVTVDPLTDTALPPLLANDETVCNILFFQFGNIYEDVNCGMSYAVRLTDGTFLLIDGGWTTESIADKLYQYLSSYNVLGGKPVISCWIFTHGHVDHIGAFATFARKYSNYVELRSICYSFPTDEQTMQSGSSSVLRHQHQIRANAARFNSQVMVYKARTGQIYQFAGCEMEILFTFEDYPQPRTLSFFNDSSLVFRLRLSDSDGTTQTFMMLGDASVNTNNILVNRYGTYLQSDAVQVAHHGYTGGTDDVYNAIAAAVVFWPCPLTDPDGVTPRFASPTFSAVTRRMLDQDYSETLYVAGLGDTVLTLTEVKDRAIVGIGMEAVKDAVPPTEETESPREEQAA